MIYHEAFESAFAIQPRRQCQWIIGLLLKLRQIGIFAVNPMAQCLREDKEYPFSEKIVGRSAIFGSRKHKFIERIGNCKKTFDSYRASCRFHYRAAALEIIINNVGQMCNPLG